MAYEEIVLEAFEEMKERGKIEKRGGQWEIRARITDDIFLFIENDVKLKLQYDKAIECRTRDTVNRMKGKVPLPLETLRRRSKDAINRMMGKAVKAVFGLVDAGQKRDPESNLIKSYMSFEVKYVI